MIFSISLNNIYIYLCIPVYSNEIRFSQHNEKLHYLSHNSSAIIRAFRFTARNKVSINELFVTLNIIIMIMLI